MDYEDMMGLEYGGLSAFDAGAVKDAVMVAAAGGVGLLAGSWLVNKTIDMEWMPEAVKNNKPMVRGLFLIGAGVVASNYIGPMQGWRPETNYALLGGLGSLGVAMIINNFLKDKAVSLSGNEDEALLSDYSGMSALAALETTGVDTSAGAFQGFADPSVTPETLMGFGGLDAAVTQTETLGYAPYLA